MVGVRGDGEVVLLGELAIAEHLHAFLVALVRKIALHDGLEAVCDLGFLLCQRAEHTGDVARVYLYAIRRVFQLAQQVRCPFLLRRAQSALIDVVLGLFPLGKLV